MLEDEELSARKGWKCFPKSEFDGYAGWQKNVQVNIFTLEILILVRGEKKKKKRLTKSCFWYLFWQQNYPTIIEHTTQ